jgi:endonuclease I
MTRAALLLALGPMSSGVFAQIPPGYYDPAMGLSGPALKAALADIISPHTVHAYSELWDDFLTTDERDENATQVWDIYSEDPDGPDPYIYDFTVDQCGNSPSGEGVCYNREHSMPQSWFNDAAPMNSDLFHIYPTDAWVNQKRGNLPYGEVGSADFTSENGTRTGTSNFPGYSGDVCEPLDAYKGDLARTYFYMLTRYMNNADTWSSPMLAAGDLTIWAENLLVQWNAEDPVSPKEVERNNDIYQIQDNRNPYIDHPEWVGSIWGPFAAVPDADRSTARGWYADGVLYRDALAGVLPCTILDASGRTIAQRMFTAPRLDLGFLTPGLYVARFADSTVRFVR